MSLNLKIDILKSTLSAMHKDIKELNDRYEAKAAKYECACCEWIKEDTEYRPEVKAKWCDDCFNDFHVSARAETMDEYETQESLRYWGII